MVISLSRIQQQREIVNLLKTSTHVQQATVDHSKFSKRSYSMVHLLRDIKWLMNSRQKLHAPPTLAKSLVERLMIAVTAVNGCIYCAWAHTKLALDSDIEIDEIRSLLDLDLQQMPDNEINAILFAQHYAETYGHPSPEMVQLLVDSYGLQHSYEILMYIQMITIGNLLGNTIDAFESRLHDKPPVNGSFWFELLVYLPTGFLMKKFMKL